MCGSLLCCQAAVFRPIASPRPVQHDVMIMLLSVDNAAVADAHAFCLPPLQEMTRISASRKELSDEVTSAKAQLKNRAKVRYVVLITPNQPRFSTPVYVRLTLGGDHFCKRMTRLNLVLVSVVVGVVGMPTCANPEVYESK